jgi:hypothetical protein
MMNLGKYSLLLVFGLIVISAPIFAQSLADGFSQTAQTTRPSRLIKPYLDELDGKYAFMARCIDHGAHTVSLRGFFWANRNGHITDGEEDLTSIDQTSARVSLYGSYELNFNGIGNLTLMTSNGNVQNFSLLLSSDLDGSLSASLVGDDSVFGVHGTVKKQPFSPRIDDDDLLEMDVEIPDVNLIQTSYLCSF